MEKRVNELTIKKIDEVLLAQKELAAEILKKQLVENKEMTMVVISTLAPKTLNELIFHFSTNDKNEIVRLIIGMELISKEKVYALIQEFLMVLYVQMDERPLEIDSLEELINLLLMHPKIRLRHLFKNQE